MGFEPTTASLEGWNSTTELRPPGFFFAKTKLRCYPALTLMHSPARARAVWWAGKDSNLGRHKPADLQSAPVGHLGTCPPTPAPDTYKISKENKTTPNTANRSSGTQKPGG